jgi:malonyl-CoA/methylmalonyl-CoA synthetase
MDEERIRGHSRRHVGAGNTSPQGTESEGGRFRVWNDHLLRPNSFAPSDLTAAGSALQVWVRNWEAFPSAPLLIDAAPASDVPDFARFGHRPGTWWTAEAFDQATRRAAGRLRAAGLEPGDRVLWSTGSSVATLIVHVGALRAGLVVVPANTGYTEREIAYVISDVRPSLAIVDAPRRALWASLSKRWAVPVVGPDLDLPDGDPGPIDGVCSTDPALICYTSGTTGAPKGAVVRHGNLLAGTEALRLAWRWTADDRLVHSLPLFHAHGLCVGVYGTLSAGASAVLLPGFDAGAVFDAAHSWRASLFFGVPTMYHRLVRSSRIEELGRLRLCVSGSAPLAAALHRSVSAAIGHSVIERYGMTETLMNTSNPYDGERRSGTVGFPLPGVEVELAADGEVLVRGPNVFDGYWERPVANGEAFVAPVDGGDHWFRTGDLATVDDGYLTIRGRSKELVISGGFNVYPGEVEEVMASHPAVVDVAVTGTPSDEWGEIVTAWLVVDGTAPSAEALAAFAADHLAPYKCPRLVHVVDALPRNAMGKVVRSRLGR